MTRTPDEQAVLQVAQRLVELRLAHYGEHGGPLLAMLVGVPHREWYGYEAGRPVPLSLLRKQAPVLLPGRTLPQMVFGLGKDPLRER